MTPTLLSYISGGVAFIAVLGCGTRTHEATQDRTPTAATRDEPLSNSIDTIHRQQLVALAEQSLAQSVPLDYRRPFSGIDADRPATASLYLAACQAGDNPSCWIAQQLGSSQATQIVRRNCQAGDTMACRTISHREETGPEVPGWAGRAICQKGSPYAPADQQKCGAEDLRRECLAGFPLSCSRLAGISKEQLPDRDVLVARISPLSRAGCQARLDDECDMVDNYTTSEKVVVAEHMCPLVINWCEVLSKHCQETGESARARDLAELSCQYGNNISRCRELGTKYANGIFPEPVRGRGEALLSWACDSEIARERDPVCKARAANQHGRRSVTP
jgi:hypothetical protein